MIGQENNLQTIATWRLNRNFPRFIIIEGSEGSGRFTLAKVIIKTLKATGVVVGNSIDNVRETIRNAYEVQSKTVYIFRNADDMSVNAKNALLKVVEEPPNNAYFIMTLQSIDGTLATIKSRGTLLKMQPYTLKQLESVTDDSLLLKYINTPGMLKQTEKTDILKAENVVMDCINALNDKSGTKLLKSLCNLQAKATETDKLSNTLFFLVFEKNLPLLNINYAQLPECLSYISAVKNDMKKSSINKKNSIETMCIKLLGVIKHGTTISEEMG